MTADQENSKPAASAIRKSDEPVDALRASQRESAESREADSGSISRSEHASDQGRASAKSMQRATAVKGVSEAVAQRDQHMPGEMASTSGKPDTKAGGKAAGNADTGKPSGLGVNPPSHVSAPAADPSQASRAPAGPSAAGVLGSSQTTLIVGLVALVIVVFLGMALWWQHQRFESVAREVATRLQSTDQTVSQLQQDTRRALASANNLTDQVGLLQREIRSIRSEVTSMDQAWQSLSRSLDDNLVLGNVRRLLSMAQQQLTLLGNVNSTISVLETAADLMANHENHERFGSLLKAVEADLERLRSTPQVNVEVLAAKLNRLVEMTEKAPLQVPDRVVPGLTSIGPTAGVQATSGVASATAQESPASSGPAQPSEPEPIAEPWWQRWTHQAAQIGSSVVRIVSQEFSDLMQIRRADSAQILLLSEEQAMLVRTNLRSMLLSAQLALLNRQSEIWLSDLNSVQSLLETYYADSLDKRAALRLIAELRNAPIALDVAPITESLRALALTSQSGGVSDRSGVNN